MDRPAQRDRGRPCVQSNAQGILNLFQLLFENRFYSFSVAEKKFETCVIGHKGSSYVYSKQKSKPKLLNNHLNLHPPLLYPYPACLIQAQVLKSKSTPLRLRQQGQHCHCWLCHRNFSPCRKMSSNWQRQRQIKRHRKKILSPQFLA